jgi:superfamily II DNA helicase RecQ
MAGPDARPRPDQVRAVEHLVEGRRRVLVVQATGWGKSAVYWAATAALRAKSAGPTLVVSPLLALMRDQIAAAERAGLRAATVNSTNVEEWGEVLAVLRSGQTDVPLIYRSGWPTHPSPPSCRSYSTSAGCWSLTRRTVSPIGTSTSGPTTYGC